jgi:hypothetical protein
VTKASPGIRVNEHIEGDGPTVFAHACKMGLEGIVSKRLGSPYVSGRSSDWLKSSGTSRSGCPTGCSCPRCRANNLTIRAVSARNVVPLVIEENSRGADAACRSGL